MAADAVYAGGAFTSIGGQNRTALAALDLTTGLTTAWNARGDGTVYDLNRVGTTLYVGGQFTTMGGQPRNCLAALDTLTGDALDWTPRLSGLTPDLQEVVYSLATAGDSLLVAGDFASIGGVRRDHIAALDTSTGEALPWDPAANDVVRVFAVSSNRVYVGGTFTNIGGTARSRLAALDPVSGRATQWDPEVIGKNAGVYALALSSDALYVGGTFTNIGRAARTSLGAVEFTQAAALDWNPGVLTAGNAPGTVNALLLVNDRVYVGGDFTTLGGMARARIGVLRTNGNQALAWDPSANNIVTSLSLSSNTVYVGGTFSTIGGQTRDRIAALEVDTGKASLWNPDAGTQNNTRVNAVRVHGGRLYVGGQFTSLGGEFRNRLASVHLSSGQASPWDPNLNGLVRALEITDDSLYVAGDFTSIGSEAHAYGAAFSLAPAFVPASAAKVANGQFSAQFASGDGEQVHVQVSSDLQHWDTLSTYDVLSKPLDFTDADALNHAN